MFALVAASVSPQRRTWPLCSLLPRPDALVIAQQIQQIQPSCLSACSVLFCSPVSRALPSFSALSLRPLAADLTRRRLRLSNGGRENTRLYGNGWFPSWNTLGRHESDHASQRDQSIHSPGAAYPPLPLANALLPCYREMPAFMLETGSPQAHEDDNSLHSTRPPAPHQQSGLPWVLYRPRPQ